MKLFDGSISCAPKGHFRPALLTAALMLGLAFAFPTKGRADDHANMVSGATSLTVGNSPVLGVIETVGDKDYFKFTVVAASEGHEFSILVDDPTTSYSTFDTNYIFETDTVVTLLDSNSTDLKEYPIAANDDYCTIETCNPPRVFSWIQHWVAPTHDPAVDTTYFIRVAHATTNGTGDYQISVTDDGAPALNDDHGNDVLNATQMTFSGGVSAVLGDLEEAGDKDYFKFTVTAANEGHEFSFLIQDPTSSTSAFSTPEYTVVFETDTRVVLLDSNSTAVKEQPIAANDDCVIGRVYSCLTWTSTQHSPAANTEYFVRIQHATTNGIGDYKMTITDLGTPVLADDHGNDVLNATPLTVGVAVDGQFERAQDRDYFDFTVTSAAEGHEFTIVVADPTTTLSPFDATIIRETDTVAILLDSNSTAAKERPIAANDDCVADCDPDRLSSFIRWIAPVHGTPVNTTYFVRVQHATTNGTGDYRITVNDNGLAILPDDHGNDVLNASPLTLGVAVGGEFERAGDKDYFSFQVTQALEGHEFSILVEDPTTSLSPFDATVVRETDTRAILLDADSSSALVEYPIAANDDYEIGRLYSRILWTAPVHSPPEDNTYFVRVQHYSTNGTGDYEITVSDNGTPILSDDHLNDVAGATPLTFSGLPPKATDLGEFERAGDKDYFKFTVAAASEGHEFSFVVADPSTSLSPFDPTIVRETDTRVILLDADSTTGREVPIAGNDDCVPNRLYSCFNWIAPVHGTPADTEYFLRIQHYSTSGLGDYEVTITDNGPAVLTDDYGNDVTSASPLTFSGGVAVAFGNLERAGDRDYFDFTVASASEGNEFTIVVADPTTSVSAFDPSVIIETDTRIILLDADSTSARELPIAASDDCGSRLYSCITWAAPVHPTPVDTDYYLRVQHYSTNGVGDYMVTITDTGSPPPPITDLHGNNFADATVMSVGTPGSEIPVFGEINPSNPEHRDVDVFKFMVDPGSVGNLFQIATDDPTPQVSSFDASVVWTTDTVIYLFDTTGNPLTLNDDCPSGGTVLSCIDWHFPAAGFYYVLVEHYHFGTGDYEITVTDTGGP